MLLKEVIAYYSKHGPLYCVMLDATKGFGEFLIPREYLRLLLNMYTNATRVSWNDICSAKFLVKNGLK